MTPLGATLALSLLAGSLALSLALRDRRDTWASLWPAGFTFWAIVALSELVAARTGVRLDASGLLLAPSMAALCALFVLLLPARLRRGAAACIVTCAALLALANVLFFRQFGVALPVEMLGRAGDAWVVRNAIAPLPSPQDWWLALPVLAAAIVVAYRPRGFDQVRAPRAAILSCAIGALPVLVCAGRDGLRHSDPGAHPLVVLRSGYLFAELADAWAALSERRSGADEPEQVDAARAFLSARRAARVRSPLFGRARGASVVLVQVESLNSWVLGAKLADGAIAPTLVSLSERGALFPNVLDQTAAGRTSDADHLSLVSQHPLPGAPVSVVAMEHEIVALPHVLAREGYATALVAADPRGLWSIARRAARYGFERALFQDELGPGEYVGWFHGDRVVFERAAELAEQLPRAFLLRVSTMSMHSPHDPLPARLDLRNLGSLEQTPLGNYLDAVSYFDRALARLIARIRELSPDALIVIHGDHGERRDLDATRIRELGVDARGLAAVPLIFVHTALGEHGAKLGPAGLLDVAPSVLELLGIEQPSSFVGTSLFGKGPALAARWDGTAVGARIWDGQRCSDRATGSNLEPGACDALRASAREELAASWFLTRQRVIPEFARLR